MTWTCSFQLLSWVAAGDSSCSHRGDKPAKSSNDSAASIRSKPPPHHLYVSVLPMMLIAGDGDRTLHPPPFIKPKSFFPHLASLPSPTASSRSMAGLEVRVRNLDCEGCSAKIRRALLKLKGVKEVDVDVESQKITVRGYAVHEKKVIKAIRSIGKTAEPWPYPRGHSHLSSFYTYPAGIVSSYYSETPGCDAAEVQAFFHTPAMYSVAVASDETVASLFSDENPNACAVM
ncbi:hypothetical protein BHM03_00049672 [Ensete ventricosum]|nr:hypothetical protein BHM03_00049672 [Ensete ventricosum]